MGTGLFGAFACTGGQTEVHPPVATASVTATPSASTPAVFDRTHPPKSGPEVAFNAPHTEEAKLSNGIRVIVVEQPGLPIVGVNVSANIGADNVYAGVGAFTTSMLMRGTTTRDAIKLSDDIEALGANIDTFGDYDSYGIGGKCLSASLDKMLDLMADIALHPAFDKKEVERERSRRLTVLGTQADRPGTLLNNAVAEMLYPSAHPYSLPLIGTEKTVKAITRDDLVSYHDSHLTPAHVTITIAGALKKDAAVAALEKAFGSWKAVAGPEYKAPMLDITKPAKSPHILLIDRPGAPQSSMLIATIGAARTTPDFDAMMVMNTIFGGMFSSRLNLNLREAHAYTYGARSGFDFRHGAGAFSAGGEILREKSGAAAKEIFNEIDRIRTEKVSDEELAGAKSTLIEALPARFETVGATAGSFATLGIFGLPLDEYATRPARFSKITADDVMRVAKKYLDPQNMVLVVVGDAAVVKAQLEDLHFGDLEVRAAAK